ncbi:MAG TPA: amino acid adenylation domain-containing protein [Candidatus Polarisedimenticolaceae bacterium]|nr:amino acid adenylation domain-containing protein [Candidatus Polarisedimenticolaceae bacterium]
MSPAPRDFLLSPGKRALLERLRAERGKTALGGGRIPRRTQAGPAPLSFAQERLWFLWQLQPDSPFYNVAQAARLSGPLDAAALIRAFGEIERRHEAVRTTVAVADGRPVQQIGSGGLAPRWVDLSELPAPEREAEAQRLANEEARRPFDLTRGPLWRLTLIRLGPDDHLLVAVLHHIVSDGWSGALLIRELAVLYEAFSRGASSPLPELPIQYADYAQWQRASLDGGAFDPSLAYWKGQLAGELPVLELPTDRPRPRHQSYRGGHRTFGISAECTQALERLGRREGGTLFMTLLAAFHALLQRWTGQDDQVVGSFFASRNRLELERLIGFFANTLVLRNDVSGDPSFVELLARVRKTTLQAFAHQDVPFERIVEELSPERDPSRHPLFQVMFILQNVPSRAPGLGETRVEQVELETGAARFDLTLCMIDQIGELGGWVEYASDLFDASTIERLIRQWTSLLEGIARDPSRRISELPLLTDTELRRIVEDWSGTSATLPSVRGVHELFVEQARREPDRLAVAGPSEEVSYGELLRRAQRLAAALRARDVGPDVCVGLSLDRSVELIVAVLGTWMAGGACLPVDPAWPAARRAFMLEDAGARVILTQARLCSGLPPTSAAVICLDEVPTAPVDDGPWPAGAPGTPDQLAYVIYTSGSTGRPKGVAVPHRCLLNLCAWHAARSPRSERTLQYASLSFDVSFQEIGSTLAWGATLVVVTEPVRLDAVALGRLIDERRVERAHLPNAMLARLAEEFAGGGGLESLREIMVGGERLRVTAPLSALFRRLPSCRLHNHYGPSETHVITSHVLDPHPGTWPELPPLGRPIQNARLYVLDRRLRPVPAGVRGELYVGGDCLARGYLHRPELTADKFVPDPFGRAAGGRLYRTGDVVRWTPHGLLEFVGRTDAQVKIRGVRIEPGEIETLLGRHAGVREAAVVVRQDTRGERQLVACYVPAPEQAVESAELRAYLGARLPQAMLPAVCEAWPAFPRMPSGKVDRRALSAGGATAVATQRVLAPRTPLERELAAIWAEVLDSAATAVDQDFFAAGGHSLLATLLLSRVRQRLQVDVPLTCFFDAPTIAGLATYVASAPPAAPLLPLAPRPVRRAGKLEEMIHEFETGAGADDPGDQGGAG